jgi:type IV secretory pathway VirB2 component (pilin)
MVERGETRVRREPRWPAVRRDWYRGAGRTAIAERTVLPRFVLSVCAFGLVWQGVARLPEPRGWGYLVPGLLAALLAWGLFTCRLWAGRITGWFAAVMALAGVVAFGLQLTRGSWLFSLDELSLAVAWTYVAVEMLRPSARELFRQAHSGPLDDAPPA